MAAAVGVSEPVSGPNKGNDDFGTGFGTGDRGQGSQCRRGHLGIRNTTVFETPERWPTRKHGAAMLRASGLVAAALTRCHASGWWVTSSECRLPASPPE